MAVHCFLRLLGPSIATVFVSLAFVAYASEPVPLVESDLVEAEVTQATPVAHTMGAVTAFDLWEEPKSLLDPIASDSLGPVALAELDECPCGDVACDSSCGGSVWVQADALIWWVKGNKTPPLITTSPDGTQRQEAGVLGAPGTTILHGGTSSDGNTRLGVRATLGYWLDDCRCTGVELTWFSLDDGNNSGDYFAQSLGTPLSPILARPFYDVVLNQQNSELVAFPNVLEGSVEVSTSNEMHSVAALLRRNWLQSCGSRLDVVGGYRFLRYREGLSITEDLTSTDPGGVVAIGTRIQVFDSFATKNDFHGAEIGLSGTIDRGPWSIDALGKIAFGNMHQTVTIDGSTVVTVPQGTPTTSAGGLLAMSSNIGRQSQDTFAMIPELNLNLRYRLSCRTSLTLGYSLLWVTDVARSGDQIDFGVNTSQLPANGPMVGPSRPAVLMNDTSMWAQGLNLGVVWQY